LAPTGKGGRTCPGNPGVYAAAAPATAANFAEMARRSGHETHPADRRYRVYQGFMKKHEKPIEQEALRRIPRDLDLPPYRESKDFQLLQHLVAKERGRDPKPRRARAA
jgi:hypothetical protein